MGGHVPMRDFSIYNGCDVTHYIVYAPPCILDPRLPHQPAHSMSRFLTVRLTYKGPTGPDPFPFHLPLCLVLVVLAPVLCSVSSEALCNISYSEKTTVRMQCRSCISSKSAVCVRD